jgi:ssDNA-binding Zn-finger/Zn-ribbon topoisomerase 1
MQDYFRMYQIVWQVTFVIDSPCSFKTPETLPRVAAETKQETPRCPRFGSEMILRTAKSGANQGGQFWGCSRYPQCRGIVSLAAISS